MSEDILEREYPRVAAAWKESIAVMEAKYGACWRLTTARTAYGISMNIVQRRLFQWISFRRRWDHLF